MGTPQKFRTEKIAMPCDLHGTGGTGGSSCSANFGGALFGAGQLGLLDATKIIIILPTYWWATVTPASQVDGRTALSSL